MALLHAAPRELGEIIELRGPRSGKLLVHAPDGLELRIPAPTGRARLWLAQPGTWSVRWGADGETVEIEVADAGEAPAAVLEPPEPPFTYTLR